MRTVGVLSVTAAVVSSLVGVSIVPIVVPAAEPTSAFIVELAPGETALGVSSEISEELNTDIQIDETFDTLLVGFSAELTPSEVEALQASPDVLAVHPDLPVSINATQTNAPWNLSRLDQDRAPADTSYTYPDSAGSGARIYVVDTGVSANPAQFGSRLLPGMTTINDGRGTADCSGHGSHVAGIVASTTYGVAKQASIVPVRVFGCDGSAFASSVVAGLDWIALNHPAGAPGIVNLSLGSDSPISSNTTDPLTTAVDDMSDRGFVMVVAAGNSSANACNYSPSRAAKALTVAATTSTDARASYSNFGACVDLFAPGSSIRSVQWNNPAGSAVMSGTSMAAPHVAGIAALVWAATPTFSAGEVVGAARANSVANVVANPGVGSPNRLAIASWLNTRVDRFGVAASIVARDSSGALWLYPVIAGQFAPRLPLGSGWSTYTALTGVGDLTGDGFRDLITVGPNSTVSLHGGTVDGAFSAPQTVSGNWSGTTALFSPGDFNGDGHNDLLSRSATGNLFLHANNGAGIVAAPRQIGNGWGGLNSLFGAGDFNGDGFADVMARNSAGQLMLYSGNGRGGWLGGTAVGSGWNAFTSIFSAGDFEGDGASDVLARLANGDLFLYSGNGRGGWKGARQVGWGWNVFTSVSGFGSGVSYPFLQSAGAGDVNRDGARDVVAVNGIGDVHRYLGNGSGSWLGAARVTGQSFANNRLVVGAGDINSSSTDDLIAVDNSGQLIHYDGDGAGGYTQGAVIGSGWGGMASVFVVGDGDGDRTFDLIARDAAGSAWFYPGTGPLGWGTRTQIATSWGSFTALFPVGDFNGDKNPDIIARSTTGLLFLIAGAGGGHWNSPVQIGNGWQAMTSLHGPGDFDGDGWADVITRDAAGNLLLYSGNGKGSWLGGRVIGSGWQGFRWIT